MRTVEIPPKPSPLIESMRDIGYSLGTSLADLVDNSIAAQATAVQVFVSAAGSDSQIGILDDGVGLTEVDLLEAMRLGSRSPLEEREPSDLGRFGLGLKTASFSQCRSLTVVSHVNGKTAGARWDLDHVSDTGRWELQILDEMSAIPWIEDVGHRGTLVVWEKLRIGSNGKGTSSRDIEDFKRQLDEARSHLELVFHRFLSARRGHRQVRITLNNRPLEPFDPFHSSHPATIAGPKEKIRVAHEEVQVQSFTLPHHSKVTPTEWERYAGSRGYLRNQGFYLYRARRLIVHGTWLGLARQTELTKLARVRIDMPTSLDGAWKIDIKKASAQLPPIVRERLRRIIEPLGATSIHVYKNRGRRRIDKNKIPVWIRMQSRGQILYRINQEHPTIVDLMSRLSLREGLDLQKIFEIAGTSLPLEALLVDLGEHTDSAIDSTTSEDALNYAARTTFVCLRKIVATREDVLAIMQVSEPFRSNWERTRQVLGEELGEEEDDA